MTEHHQDFAKLAVIWVGTITGCLTMQKVVLFLTAIYTILNIVKLLRELSRG
jgi:hypothetical protein